VCERSLRLAHVQFAMPNPTELISSVERLVRRDRLIASGGLFALVLLAWSHLLRMDRDMAMGMSNMDTAGTQMSMSGMVMPAAQAWTEGEVFLLFLMWSVMMTAMMLPSAAPTILLVLAAHRRSGGRASIPASACFVAGYLVVWTGFSGLAAFTQWVLQRASLLSSEMKAAAPAMGGILLVLAGVYQWLPLKNACLSHCRSPIAFLTRHWRPGVAGSFRIGVVHGAYCVGCCWALMALLFVAGVMNLLWVAVIAAFVLVEKLAREGPLVGRIAGVLLAAWGGWVIVRSL
jgi:predicted metal-binding membrane protein